MNTFTTVASRVLMVSLLSLPVSAQQAATPASVKIMLLGVDHLSQLYEQAPESDVYNKQKQAELARLRADLAKFSPAQIMLEVDNSEQGALSAEYQAFLTGELDIQDQEYGRSEKYQIGFKLAKSLALKDVYAANYYDYTPQSALSSGDNIEIFSKALSALQQTVRPLSTQVKQQQLSLYDYLTFMNLPETVQFSHRILFNVPAYVINGDFNDQAKQKIGNTTINKRYIGAQYIGLFYQRNVNIYSNILLGQQQSQAKRILLIFGQLHIGVLQELLQQNPHFELVSPLKYLDTSVAAKIPASFAY